MSSLATMICVPCRKGEPALTEAEVQRLLPDVPEWRLMHRDGMPTLQRIYTVHDFAAALALADAIGAAAEAQGHHPLLTIEWGRLTAQWWTHAVKGLHRNDFIMAARSDALFAAQASS